MTTIGVISDTHVSPGGKRVLAPIVFELFAKVDMIFHAGDLNTLETLRDLESIAPVVAVYGNNCDAETAMTLPQKREVQVESSLIGLTHGDVGRGGDTASIALGHFPEADCVIFGHSHWPMIHWKRRENGGMVLLFNPGSAGQKRRAEHFSCGLLRVDGNVLEPQLLTWD